MAAKQDDIDPELYEYAKKRVKKKRDAGQFLIVTLVVNGMLTLIWALTTPASYFWPVWVMFGMGIGVVFAFLDAYTILGGKPITDTVIRAEVEKIAKRG